MGRPSHSLFLQGGCAVVLCATGDKLPRKISSLDSTNNDHTRTDFPQYILIPFCFSLPSCGRLTVSLHRQSPGGATQVQERVGQRHALHRRVCRHQPRQCRILSWYLCPEDHLGCGGAYCCCGQMSLLVTSSYTSEYGLAFTWQEFGAPFLGPWANRRSSSSLLLVS